MFGPRSSSLVGIGILMVQILSLLPPVYSQPDRLRLPDVSFDYSSFDDTAASSLLLSGDVSIPGKANDGAGGYIQLVTGGQPWDPEEGTQTFGGRILQNVGISMVNKSFSTQFTFTIDKLGSNWDIDGEDGLAFVLVSNPNARVSVVPGAFGIFDGSGLAHDVALAVEFDTFRNPNFNDIEVPHVGVDRFDIRSMESKQVSPICLNCGTAITAWIDYSNWNQLLEIRVANTSPLSSFPMKPTDALLRHDVDLSTVVSPVMWVGFGASTSNFPNSTQSHFIHRWSFQTFNESSPPDGMKMGDSSVSSSRIGVGLGVGFASLAVLSVLALSVWKCRMLKGHGASSQQVDDDVLQFVDGPHKYKYKELSKATDNFSEESKLGEGGFGNVYRGVLRHNGKEFAVKTMSRDSRQGLKEFLAEVSIISRLRHRNLVQLLGYCTDNGKFLLVYDYMPRGSLDKHLLSMGEILNWSRRFNIIKGVAAALDYLHEGWQQQVIHRDVKPSNVMLDKDYNAKLGDFGLARLREHQIVPQTTRIAGTWGYIAPELVYTGKATNKTDVYSFGAMILEIASGRPVVDRSAETESVLLVDTIWDYRQKGNILGAADESLGGEFVSHEMETVLLMGLLCSHPEPEQRPTMRQLLHIFNGDAQLPEVPMAKPVQTYTSPTSIKDFPMQSSSVESVNSSLFSSSTTMDSSNRATPMSDHVQLPR